MDVMDEETEETSQFIKEITPRSVKERSSSQISLYRVRCEHCHHPTPEGTGQRRKIIATTIFCFVFMVAEVVGGVLANSLTIGSDAAHMLTDIGAFMVSLVAISLSNRKPTRRLNYGFYRVEILGALISVLLLWLVTGVLVYMAVERLLDQRFELDVQIMMIVAVAGIVVNIIMCFMLTCTCNIRHPRFNVTLNLRTAVLHVIGDLLQSVAVLVAASVIYIEPTYKIADPICTFIFSTIILATTFKTVRDIITVLMEGVPKGIDVDEIQMRLLAVPDVVRVYNLRVWALTLGKTALSAHLAIGRGGNAITVLKEARESMKEKGFFEMTIQIEPYESTSTLCKECEGNNPLDDESRHSSEPVIDDATFVDILRSSDDKTKSS